MSGKIRLEWNKTNANGYYIYRVVSGVYTKIAKTQNNYYVMSHLAAGTDYTYAIRGYLKDGLNNEALSSYKTIKVSTVPSVPSFKCTVIGSSVKVSWEEVSGAAEYIVYKKLMNGSWEKVKVTSGLSCVMFGLPENESFYITVRACKKANGINYYSDFESKRIDPVNHIYSGTIFACGDSITYGAGSHGVSYADLFSVKYNLKLTKSAVGGATLSCATKAAHIPELALKANKKYDYVIINGGINDYFANCTLGSVSDKNSKSFDTNTSCGGLESIIYYFKSNYPQTKLYYLSMHKANNTEKIPNALGLTYADYVDKFTQICNKYGVTIIDCYNSDFNTSQISLKKAYTRKGDGVYPNGDGIHPTEAGYLKYYLPIIEKTVWD